MSARIYRKKMPAALRVLVFFLLITGVFPVCADETTRAFLDGIKYYNSEDYEKAAGEFKKIAETGLENGNFFYNMGNAYLKNNETGHAILWYERALELIPDDPDLKFNLEYARSFIKDEKSDPAFPVYKIIFFWKHLLPKNRAVWIAATLNLLFWATIAYLAWRKEKIFKMRVFALIFLTMTFVCTAFYNYFESAYKKEGIVLSKELSVRSGLSEKSTELFVLHAGTKVRIEKEIKDYLRIYFSEGKIGWVNRKEIGVI